jgi:putative DNA methylase
MRKKMIEVAIPLDAINRESAREKSIRHGHPSTLHLWWARRPLAACRAVLFASLVDDPDSDPANRNDEGVIDPDKVTKRRHELFELLSDLVKWENAHDETLIARARAEIACSCVSSKVFDSKEWTITQCVCGDSAENFLSRRATADSVNRLLSEHLPPLLDPFAGGGSIPLEGQRLGMKAYASDLNPVPVLINKALLEIPPAFAGREPVASRPPPHTSRLGNKKVLQKTFVHRTWKGAEGLAEDVRHYGKWIASEAEKRIGGLYPKVQIGEECLCSRPDLEPYANQELPVVAWLWARTVASPNPAASGAHVPLVRSFRLSGKGKRRFGLTPTIDGNSGRIRFQIVTDGSEPQQGTVNRKGATCLLTGSPIPLEYIREQGRAGRLGAQMLGIVAEAPRGRLYLPALQRHVEAASVASCHAGPDTELPKEALGFRVQNYGMTRHAQLFTSRQIATLTELGHLVSAARDRVLRESSNDQAYADAIATYLALAVDRVAMTCNALGRWNPVGEKVQHAFGRQTLSMVWDYPEANALGSTTGSWNAAVELVAAPLALLGRGVPVTVTQEAAQQHRLVKPYLYSTDPPYYDNVPYADLADFFYVWLRQVLQPVYPELLSTVLVPKADELVAEPFRHGGKNAARQFFEDGMKQTLSRMRANCDTQYPATVYYAFKQSESLENEDPAEDDEEVVPDETVGVPTSTGWETMLEGLMGAGWQITATWPIRTEMRTRMRGMGSNALASSIVLACRPRPDQAPVISRRDFVGALKRELPVSLKDLQSGNIAPVDLAQAAIGPGMAIYSRYSKVLESSGDRLTVRTALALINQVLDEVLAEQEGDYDADTRWSLKWYELFSHGEGSFSDANTLATAMSIGINGLVETGIVQAKGGKVRLLKRPELMSGRPETWDPATDTDIVHWEVCQYLIHALDTKGEAGAAALLRRINARYPGAAETARELAYRLYTICERKKWAQEAMAYNSLIVAWPEIVKLAQSSDGSGGEAQTTMF